jgi:hypothetical protein
MIECPRGCGQEFTLLKWLASGAAHVVWECPGTSGTSYVRENDYSALHPDFVKGGEEE